MLGAGISALKASLNGASCSGYRPLWFLRHMHTGFNEQSSFAASLRCSQHRICHQMLMKRGCLASGHVLLLLEPGQLEHAGTCRNALSTVVRVKVRRAHQRRLCSAFVGAQLQIPLPLSFGLGQRLPVNGPVQMLLVLRIASKVGLQDAACFTDKQCSTGHLCMCPSALAISCCGMEERL